MTRAEAKLLKVYLAMAREMKTRLEQDDITLSNDHILTMFLYLTRAPNGHGGTYRFIDVVTDPDDREVIQLLGQYDITQENIIAVARTDGFTQSLDLYVCYRDSESPPPEPHPYYDAAIQLVRIIQEVRGPVLIETISRQARETPIMGVEVIDEAAIQRLTEGLARQHEPTLQQIPAVPPQTGGLLSTLDERIEAGLLPARHMIGLTREVPIVGDDTVPPKNTPATGFDPVRAAERITRPVDVVK